MVVVLNRNDSVITRCLIAVVLFGLDNSDRPTREDAARERGLIHKHQHIDRIAVFRTSGRDESEVIRKRHACGQNLLQMKDLFFEVKGVLVPATLRRFDYDADGLFIVLRQCQRRWVPKAGRANSF